MHNFSKSVIALAIAATPVLASADMTVYGDFRYSLASIAPEADGADSTMDFVNNASRVGIKGSYKENGMTAFYHMQSGLNNEGGDTFTNRFFFAGLKGDFGSVKFGRLSTPYKMVGVKMDPFYDTTSGTGNGGATYGLSPLTNGFTDNSLVYSNKFGPVSLDLGMFVDGSEEGSHDTNIGLGYAANGIKVSFQTVNIGDTAVIAKATADTSASRLFGSYTTKQFTVAASLETVEDDNYTYLTGSYFMSPATKISVSFGNFEQDADVSSGTSTTLGVFHKLMKKTTIHALTSTTETDDEAGRSVFSVGIKQQF